MKAHEQAGHLAAAAAAGHPHTPPPPPGSAAAAGYPHAPHPHQLMDMYSGMAPATAINTMDWKNTSQVSDIHIKNLAS